MIRRIGNFWKPLIMDGDGFYVTEGQLDFFLLRPSGYKSVIDYFKNEDNLSEFGSYIESCKIYNVIRDMSKLNSGSAKMYWDTKDKSMKFSYPENGTIDLMVRSIIEGEDDL
mgnify:FL=1|tara:strand:- start:2744 stop:3079 length:336 start_codon:yes stop_codon:yes gene_type:complete